MKNLFRASALAVLVLTATAVRSSAGVVFTLNDVKLVVGNTYPAGELTGTFTMSDDLKTLLAADIKATGATVNGFTYAPTTYPLTDPRSTYTDQLPYNFRLNLGATRQLQLVFAGGLSTSGPISFASNSYEWQWNAGPRTVASGWVTAGTPATPEPSSIVMAAVAAGVGAAAWTRARRRRGPGQVS